MGDGGNNSKADALWIFMDVKVTAVIRTMSIDLVTELSVLCKTIYIILLEGIMLRLSGAIWSD